MASQLRAAAAAQAQAQGQQVPDAEPTPDQQAPVARRSAQGSAMQQLNTIIGG